MFFSGLFQRKSDAPVTTPAELADAIGLSYDTYTGKQISSQRAMRLTAVFSCVRVLAESVGMLPCNLYHLNGSLKQRATGERLHKLISTHPNGYMTPQEFWELVVTCLCLRGNFYAYKVKAFGEVAELLPVDPGCVVPKLNSSWEPVYQVTFPDGSTDVLSQEDIWHVRTLTLDGLVGLNPIAYAREAISLAAATEEHGARLFSNGAVTSGVLRTEQTLSDQAYERLKKDFEERHTGLGNAHRPMILEMGLDWKSMALNAEDSQFLETRKFQLEEICRLFRVPLHMVQNTDRATFNNIEELGLGFINYSLVPYLTRIEQRINTGLAILKLGLMGVGGAISIVSRIMSMTPIGMIATAIALAAGLIITNWDVVGPYFKKLWETIGPYFEAGWELLKKVFAWSPLGMVINNWGPIVKWFQDMWEKLRPIIEWFSDGASDTVAAANAAQWGAGGYGAYGTGVASSGYNPYQIKQGTATQPKGTITVEFKGAPQGMSVTDTRSSGIDVIHDVGYTRIGRTGMGG